MYVCFVKMNIFTKSVKFNILYTSIELFLNNKWPQQQKASQAADHAHFVVALLPQATHWIIKLLPAIVGMMENMKNKTKKLKTTKLLFVIRTNLTATWGKHFVWDSRPQNQNLWLIRRWGNGCYGDVEVWRRFGTYLCESMAAKVKNQSFRHLQWLKCSARVPRYHGNRESGISSVGMSDVWDKKRWLLQICIWPPPPPLTSPPLGGGLLILDTSFSL